MKTKTNELESESSETHCWVENPQTQVLRVESSNGSFHLFPYAWLVWIQFSPTEASDTVTLVFNSHTISLIGRNLRVLGLAFQRMTVECVKVQAESGGPNGSKVNPFIESIQIEEVLTK